MSILEKDKVDGIALKNNDTIVLMISDHLDWSDEYAHLVMLQEKINAYIGFCESEQYTQIYTDFKAENFVFEIHFLHKITDKAHGFLNQVQTQLSETVFSIEYNISADN